MEVREEQWKKPIYQRRIQQPGHMRWRPATGNDEERRVRLAINPH